MTKSARRWLFSNSILFVLALFLGAGCKPAPKAKSVFDIQKTQMQLRKWREATLPGAYDSVGQHDPKWDLVAHQALERFVDMNLDDVADQDNDAARFESFLQSAMSAGCTDPLIRYFYNVRIYPRESHATNEMFDTYTKGAQDMNASSYPEIRKFYASLRYYKAMVYVDRHRNELYGPLMNDCLTHLVNAMDDKDCPPIEAQNAAVEVLELMRGTDSDYYSHVYEQLEHKAAARFPDTAVPYAITGKFYVNFAWKARGNGGADSVTPEGWKLFGQRLEKAEDALDRGWRADPGDAFCPTEMLPLCMGAGKDREETEKWFARAMAANTNNYDACYYMEELLKPKWGGSHEEMYAFGLRCETNETWGGNVPLTMADAIWSIACESTNQTEFCANRQFGRISKRVTPYFSRRIPARSRGAIITSGLQTRRVIGTS